MARLSTAIAVALAAISFAAHAQSPIPLDKAAARQAPDQTPALQGKQVTVQGVVSSKAILFGDYALLPLRDNNGKGLLVEAPDFMFERVTPGDLLEVRGIIAQRDGMPVLQPVQLTTLSQSQPPSPLSRRVEQLENSAAIGLTVLIQGRVVALGEDAGGEYIQLDDGQKDSYSVYLPKAASRIGAGLGRYQIGDRIRVTGVALQADSDPPHDANFRLGITDASSVTLIDRNWLVSPQLILAAVVGFLVLGGWLVHRRQRLLSSRRAVRRIHSFCEDLLTAASFDEVHRKLRNIAPRALEITGIELYRIDRQTQMLRRTFSPQLESIPTQSSPDSEKGDHAIALCFRNRTPLHVPDTRRSPLFWGANRERIPRAVVLLPMFAREELMGVLEIAQFDRPRHFSSQELVALQHMANQIAIVGKLIDQQSRKEQMMRSERLAATGQIISGVASELKRPLDSILMLAHKLLDQGGNEARSILNESLRASAILHRYSQVARSDEDEASTVEINALLRGVIDSCHKEISASEVRLDTSLAGEALWVAGSPSQMQNVVRNLLLLAARSAKPSLDRSVQILSTQNLRRVLITIRYGALYFDENIITALATPQDPDSLGFTVCRGILQGQGGELRVVRAGEHACSMEIELPAAYPDQDLPVAPPASGTRSTRTLTALILEPDPTAQRRLISYWSSRHHRAVPVHEEAEAQELLNRIRIDVIFCSVRVGATNWVDLFDRFRDQVPVFVLLTDGMESDASELFPEGEGLVLRKPMEAGEMDRLLDRIEQRVENGAHTAA